MIHSPRVTTETSCTIPPGIQHTTRGRRSTRKFRCGSKLAADGRNEPLLARVTGDAAVPDANAVVEAVPASLAAKRVIEIVNLRKVFNAKPDNKVAVDDISLDMYRPFAPQRVG